MEAVHNAIVKQHEQKKVIEVISNSKALKEDIQKAATKVLKLKEERRAINDKIKSVRSDLEAKGLDRKAFDMCLAYFEKNLAQREGFEESYKVVQDALAELEGDLFSGPKKANE